MHSTGLKHVYAHVINIQILKLSMYECILYIGYAHGHTQSNYKIQNSTHIGYCSARHGQETTHTADGRLVTRIR